MVHSEAELLAAARRLAKTAGKPEPLSLQRLPGGRNNQVFRVAMAEGPPLFLKSYFFDPRDPRERLAAEWQFLNYAWARGVRVVPEPLAADRDLQTGLYQFVSGHKLGPGDISWRHLGAALDFLIALNVPPRQTADMPRASEASFSLAQHIATVDGRVRNLETLHPEVPHRERAARFVRDRLIPCWAEVRRSIETTAADRGIDPGAEIADADTIVSPSDFGFHNIIVGEGDRLNFTDFEYAGRDDPAKLVCDFFCQPEMPAPLQHYDRFVASLTEGLGLGPLPALRCRLLLDAYRVKWTCIILNDFRPVGAAQRAFARGDSWARRCAQQLTKAEAKISEISTAREGCVN
jgi:Phosphotransferase enzyme family